MGIEAKSCYAHLDLQSAIKCPKSWPIVPPLHELGDWQQAGPRAGIRPRTQHPGQRIVQRVQAEYHCMWHYVPTTVVLGLSSIPAL